ncbi:MAG: hypothetical protein U0Q16_30240 [Bryobacteraceae bacterium]
MTKLTTALLTCSLMALGAEWTGAISESGCGAKHANGGAEKCVSGCVKKGAAPVFVTDGKVIKIANAEKVMDHLGKKVKLTGKLEGETVTVDSVSGVSE